MERTAMANLQAWKDAADRKPLIIEGARQVGKTWLIEEFGRRSYSRTITVNFDTATPAHALFTGRVDIDRVVTGLSLLDRRGPIDPLDTLIILDEIQSQPAALTSLKYFAEQAPQYRVIAAGSLLGVELHSDFSFPVGQVSFLDLYPLTFREFLDALGETELSHLIDSRDFALLNVFHDRLVDLLRWYLYVGGMPRAVETYVRTHDVRAVRGVHEDLLRAYDRDFSKHAPTEVVPRIRAVYESLPAHLARENKKFVYGHVRQGARAKDLESAIEWLSDAGMVHRVNRVGTPRLPLAAYADQQAFKLYHLDTGLLAAMCDLDEQTLIEPNRLFTEFRGALTEQYVLQELIAAGMTPWYWTRQTGRAEIDFIISAGGEAVPIEVKAGVSLQAKSLRVYRDTYTPGTAVRTSLAPHIDQEGLICLPLYALSTLSTMVSPARATQLSRLTVQSCVELPLQMNT